MTRSVRRSVALIAALGALAAAPSVASGAVYVSPTGTDAGTCTSGAPCLTLDYAVSQATDPDTVNIAAGTYTGASNREVSFSKELTFQGAAKATTIIDGQDQSWLFQSLADPVTFRNLTLKDANNGSLNGGGGAVTAYDNVNTYFEVILDNVAATGNITSWYGGVARGQNVTVSGSSSFTGNEADYGGALYAESSAEVDPGNGQTATFTNNYADSDGGSIYTDTGVLTVDNSTFTGDPDPMAFSAGDDGGALFAYTDTPAEFDLVVTDSTFTGFRIEGYYGGALSAYNGGASLEDVTVTDSFTGEYGGGLYSDEDATIIDSTFERNDTDCCEGGGAYVGGVATVEDSTFRNNKADGGSDDGGGIYVSEGADISGSTFVGNEADSGAGAYIDTGSSNTTTIEDSTFEANTAGSYGGGLYLDNRGLDVRGQHRR